MASDFASELEADFGDDSGVAFGDESQAAKLSTRTTAARTAEIALFINNHLYPMTLITVYHM